MTKFHTRRMHGRVFVSKYVYNMLVAVEFVASKNVPLLVPDRSLSGIILSA
jgi:hypothetical protein